MSRCVTSQRTPAASDGTTRAWKTPATAATVAAMPHPSTYGPAVFAPWSRSATKAISWAIAQTPSLTAAAAGFATAKKTNRQPSCNISPGRVTARASSAMPVVCANSSDTSARDHAEDEADHQRDTGRAGYLLALALVLGHAEADEHRLGAQRACEVQQQEIGREHQAERAELVRRDRSRDRDRQREIRDARERLVDEAPGRPPVQRPRGGVGRCLGHRTRDPLEAAARWRRARYAVVFLPIAQPGLRPLAQSFNTHLSTLRTSGDFAAWRPAMISESWPARGDDIDMFAP